MNCFALETNCFALETYCFALETHCFALESKQVDQKRFLERSNQLLFSLFHQKNIYLQLIFTLKRRNAFKINNRNIETKDAENGYISMGARTYCQDIGRFLQPDPLFEAFARHTPYHYSYNSPLVWLDPSGLAPEKEKGEERLLYFEYDTILFEVMESNYQEGIQERNSVGFSANHYVWGELYMRLGWDAANELIGFFEDGVFNSSAYELSLNNPKSGGGGSADNGVSSGMPSKSDGGKAEFSHTQVLGNPKSWSDKEYTAFIEKANADLTSLQSRNPNKEVGYFLRYDKEDNTLYADYFIGESASTWLNPSKNPYGRELSKSEMILGFTHTHPDGPDYFSPDDNAHVSDMSLGLYKWTNIPKNSSNPLHYNKMSFGLFYRITDESNNIISGKVAFRWQLTTKEGVQALRNNIYCFGDGTIVRNLTKYPGIKIIFKR